MTTEPPDDTPFAALANDLPVVLLPVRLETRFLPRTETTADGTEVTVPTLAVRIYPDDIAVDGHDPALTEAEAGAGTAFHETVAAATGDDAERQRWAAWEVLVSTVGPARALHVTTATAPGAPAPPNRTTARPPARARLLPERWAVTAWSRGVRVVACTTAPVTPDLPVTPPPRADGGLDFDPATGGTVFDDASAWVADLDAAVAAGMAVVADLLTPEQVLAGVAPPDVLDRVFVFGIHTDGDTDALAGLLGAHGATGTAGFVANGAATNNLGDKRSVWSATRDEVDLFRRATAPGGAVVPEEVSVGSRAAASMATALGVPGAVFDRWADPDLADRFHARLMAEATYPATWGELFGQLLVPAEVDATRDRAALDRLAAAGLFAYDHVRDHLRPGGPLTTMRIGGQPYGVLPVTRSAGYRPQPGEPPALDGLRRLLDSAWHFWKRAAAETPALAPPGQGLDDAGRRLLQVLGLGPVPHPGAYVARAASGPLTATVYSSTHPELFGIVDGTTPLTVDGIGAITTRAGVSVLRAMLGAIPPMVHGSLLEGMTLGEGELVRVPVAVDDPDRAELPRVADYLRALSQWLPPFDPPVETPPMDLLYQLVQRSLLLANEQSGLALLRELVPDDNPFAIDVLSLSPELGALGLLADGPDTTPDAARLSSMAVADVARLAGIGFEAGIDDEVAVMSIGAVVSSSDLIGQLLGPDAVAVLSPLFRQTELFRSTSDAVAALAAMELDGDTYTRLLGETLAGATTRLDAWYTSLATQRLATLRAARPTGAAVGQFGWLVDLRPDEAEEAAAPVGWIHAPSLDQAITGAVLRGGEIAHEAGQTHLARIDLTSDRVRTGAWIVDAVHNGQPLGAVLGYRLERLFHDRSDLGAGVNLHRYVDDLRRRHPQRSVPSTDGDREQVVPHEVVDGVGAWTAWSEGRLAFDTALAAAEVAVVEGIFRELDGAVDSVADLLLAEGVHQLAAGSLTRAAATFEAVANGTSPPDGVDVLRTPRQGTTVTHRVVAGCGPIPGGGWTDDAERARVAPAAEAWARRWLGSATGWTLSGPGGAPVSLADLDVCALDVVAEAGASDADVPALATRVVARTGGLAAAVPVGEGDWPRLIGVAATVGESLAAARAVVPADLAVPAQVTDATTTRAAPPAEVTAASLAAVEAALAGPGGLAARVRAAAVAVQALLPDPLADPAAPAPPTDVDAVRAALADLAALAQAGASVHADAPEAEVLTAATGAVAAALRGADAADAALVQPPGGAPEPAQRLRALQAAATALLGASTVVTPDLDSAGDVAANRLPDPSPFAVADWLDTMARVRSGLGAVVDLTRFAGPEGAPAATVSHLPSRPGEAWLGSALSTRGGGAGGNPHRAWQGPVGPTVHVAVLGADPGPGTPGLVLDEWSEVLPSATATTGMAVHYDAPDARAPQAVLVAVHPDPAGGEAWSWSMVESMLHETLDLAEVRLVDLDQLGVTAVDEYLPATYLREGLRNTRALADLITDHIAVAGAWSAYTLAANRGGA